MTMLMTTASTARRTARKTAKVKSRLLLAIGDELYELLAVVDDPDFPGVQNWLRKPGGRWFAVWDHPCTGWPELARTPYPHHCDGCDADDCRHIDALIDVDLA